MNNLSYAGYKEYTIVKKFICPNCNKEHHRHDAEVPYLAKENNKIKEFCSYTCRSKYLKAHPKAISGPFPRSQIQKLK